MNIKASWFYAIRMIKPEKSQGKKSLFGAMFAVAISLVPLVVVLMISDGMVQGITGRLIGLSSYHLQVFQKEIIYIQKDDNLALLDSLVKKIESIDGVRGAFIERHGSALAVGKKQRSGVVIRGVPKNIFTQNAAFAQYMECIEGSLTFPTEHSVLIGKKTANELNVSVGDSIRFVSAQYKNTKLLPKVLSATVSGIISTGYEELDSHWVFLPLSTAYTYLSDSSSQIIIGVELENPFSSDLISVDRQITSFLPANFMLFKWNDLNQSQFENYASTKLLLLFIMFLILLIASVNISSALIMIIIERQKEIAILKSMGASPFGISLSFVLCGLLCGMGSLIIGLPIGLLLGYFSNEILLFIENTVNLSLKLWYLVSGGSDFIPFTVLDPAFYLEQIPVFIPWGELLIIVISTMVLAVIVSVLPAMRAGKEKPLHILRKI